jgi:hypothetical protein
MRLDDRDGHGRYGVVDEDDDGLLCSECGWRGRHLGLHAYRAHGLTAAQYKERHGLRRSKGLVADSIRVALRTRAVDQYPTRIAFQVARNPAQASRTRRQLARPVAAEAAASRDQRMAAMARSSRLGTVVVCGYCGCEFCPLVSARRRRFCSRSCASKFNRTRYG